MRSDRGMSIVGLFGYISGTIKNVGLTNVIINTDSINTSGIIGGIAGNSDTYNDNGSSVLIDNCFVSGMINDLSGGTVGGIAGRITNIKNCYNEATIYSSFWGGGISGSVHKISNCFNVGEVIVNSKSGYATQVGGITGHLGSAGWTGAKLEECYNIANVTAYSKSDIYVGGLIGYASSFSRIEDIAEGLRDLINIIRNYNIKSIAVPALGCGLGGLEWKAVKPLIELAFSQFNDVEVIIFEPIGTPCE